MERTVVDDDLQVDDRVTGDRALFQRTFVTLLDRRDVVRRNDAAGDFVLEDKGFFRVRFFFRNRRHNTANVRELPGTAGLFLVLRIEFDRLRRRFAVVDFRRGRFDFDLIFAANTFDVNVEVEFAHPGDEGFAAFRVGFDRQGRVFLTEAIEGLAEFVRVAGFASLNRDLDNRFRNENRFERAVVRRFAVRFAGRTFDTDDRDDVAGAGGVEFDPLFGVHAEDAADAFFMAGALVDVGFALLERPFVNAHKGERPVRVFDRFERHRDQRTVVRRSENEFFFFAGFFIDAERGAFAVERRRKVTGNRVEQELNALVAVRGPHEDRGELARLRRVFDDFVNQLERNFAFFEERFHHLVAVHRERFEHILARFFVFVDEFRRNIFFANFFALRAVEVISATGDQVDDAFEVLLGADRDLHHHRFAVELFVQLLNDAARVRSDAVHFVDERQARNAVTLHLAVDGERLRLNAADRAENQNGAVQNAEAAFDFDREVDVAGRVDQVDRRVAPFDAGRGAGDRNPAFLFEIHTVHRRAAVVNFADFVRATGVKENALAKSRLSGVDVSGNTNVAPIF